MRKENTFCCFGGHYRFPPEYNSIDSLIQHINTGEQRFIKLTQFQTDNCVYPYYIESETKEIYLNFSPISIVEEEEIYVLSKEEYDEKLKQCVEEKCVNCVHYKEDLEGDYLAGHRERLSLDGECWAFEEID